MDTYGYLYYNSFNPAYGSQNLLLYSDDDADHLQFLLRFKLEAMTKYVVVVTTFGGGVTGPFTIFAKGVGSVSFLDE